MKSNSSFWLYFSLLFYISSIVLGVIFSYSFTDPNLVLSSNPVYWQFQQWMWHTWFDHPFFQAQTFVMILTVQWGFYGMMSWQCGQRIKRQERLRINKLVSIIFGVAVVANLCSYNALSHDVFNYIFNARMVVAYQANPHTQTALNFIGDPWLRFMHNTHTTAPYGYGWTGLSIIPYQLGGGKFLPTWLLFRILSVVSLLATGLVMRQWLAILGLQKKQWLVVLLGVSPFVLSEVIMNAHNDLWMMLPALSSVYLLERWRVQGKWTQLLGSSVLLGLSIFIKIATLMLVPLLLGTLLIRWKRNRSKLFQLETSDVTLLASVLMCIPLLSARSQYFQPWYLLWPLVWLPLIKQQWWQAILIGFAISSTYRYLPWIATGGFEGQVVQQQQLITWLGGILMTGLVWLLMRRYMKSV